MLYATADVAIKAAKPPTASVPHIASPKHVPSPVHNANARDWGMRKKLFVFLHRNARSATESFGIPPNRVVEMGGQVEF